MYKGGKEEEEDSIFKIWNAPHRNNTHTRYEGMQTHTFPFGTKKVGGKEISLQRVVFVSQVYTFYTPRGRNVKNKTLKHTHKMSRNLIRGLLTKLKSQIEK